MNALLNCRCRVKIAKAMVIAFRIALRNGGRRKLGCNTVGHPPKIPGRLAGSVSWTVMVRLDHIPPSIPMVMVRQPHGVLTICPLQPIAPMSRCTQLGSLRQTFIVPELKALMSTLDCISVFP